MAIHCKNIDEFSQRIRRSEVQRSISVSELIEFFSKSVSVKDAASAYRAFTEALPLSRHTDRAELCASLAEQEIFCQGIWSKAFMERNEKVAAGVHGRVALVRNKYNEAAFELFSRTITRPKSVYANSFASACEDVYDGACEFCILPVENSQSGKLFSFYSMLDRYELKICALCSVDTDDGQETVWYALAGKNPPDRLPKSKKKQLECAIIPSDGRFPLDILTVSEKLGAELLKADSLPVSYDDGQQKYFFTFDIRKANLFALDLYMSLEHGGYTPIGLYPILN